MTHLAVWRLKTLPRTTDAEHRRGYADELAP